MIVPETERDRLLLNLRVRAAVLRRRIPADELTADLLERAERYIKDPPEQN